MENIFRVDLSNFEEGDYLDEMVDEIYTALEDVVQLVNYDHTEIAGYCDSLKENLDEQAYNNLSEIAKKYGGFPIVRDDGSEYIMFTVDGDIEKRGL